MVKRIYKNRLSYVVCFAWLWSNSISVIIPSPVGASEPTIRIALFIDKGAEASEFTKELERNDDASIVYKTIDGADLRAGALQHFDAILVPGGSASEESGSMGPSARQEVRRFVSAGGIYMGICAGAYLASQAAKTDIGMLPLKTVDKEHWYRVDDATRVDVELTPEGMEAFGIDKPNIRVKYENGPIFAHPDAQSDNPLTPLGFFRSEVVGDGGERGVMIGAPAIVIAHYGQGIVMVISPHFEETPGFKQVQLHAIRWMYQHRGLPPQNSAAEQISLSRNTPLPLRENQSKSNSHPQAASLPQHVISQSQPKNQQRQNNQNRNSTLASTNPWSAMSVAAVPSAIQTDRQKTEISSAAQDKNEHADSSSLGERALKLAESVFANASDVHYAHKETIAARQIIKEPDGTLQAHTDCSGFISYLVHSVAPRHYFFIRTQEPNASYPQAKIWARIFNTLDSNQPYHGWLGISNWHDLQPGDIIAWQEGTLKAGGNTGHVMMVVNPPSEVKTLNELRFFEVKVIDSSSVYHFAPEQLPPKASQRNRDGIGEGTIRIILSPDNKPVGYWAGTYWGEGQKNVKGPTLSRLVRFARMVHLEDTDY